MKNNRISRNLRSPMWGALASTVAFYSTFFSSTAAGLDGGTLRVRVEPTNNWKAFEVISIGDDPAGDGSNWSMPGTFDGLGAWLPDASTLRVQVNHETGDATISEVDLDMTSFQTAISNTINSGSTGGGSFVTSARQAYDRWSDDGGATWTDTTDTSNTSFSRFCSGQSYHPNTFGVGRGFVDDVYVTGEEGGTDRLFTFDLDLDFSGGSFSAAGSGFSITKVQDHIDNTDGSFGDADNVDWTAPTVLGGTTYSNGLIFVNEDTGTGNGEIWVNAPDGTGLTLIGDTAGISGATETSGILDISNLVGYYPGSIVLTDNQGSNSSLTLLINPDAVEIPDAAADLNMDGLVDSVDLGILLGNFGTATTPDMGELNGAPPVDSQDLGLLLAVFGTSGSLASAAAAVPEPSAILLAALASIGLALRRSAGEN